MTAFSAVADLTAGTPEQKTFERVVNYEYVERRLDPEGTALQWLDAALAGNPRPDAQLVSMLSAMRAGDFDWWVGTWDAATQAELRAGIAQQQTFNEWRALFSDNEIRLGRWIEIQQFVLVSYFVRPRARPAAQHEVFVTFALDKGFWRATSAPATIVPLVEALEAGEDVVERQIR
jgi:hypothetical protein